MDKKLIKNVIIEGIDLNDFPDFTDAFIVSAFYNDKPMTEKQLNEINKDREFVNNHTWLTIHS